MKAILAPTLRGGYLIFAALLLVLAALWPLAQTALADATSYPLLYAPGPSTDCYSTVVESPPDGNTSPPAPQGQDLSGCTPDQQDPTFSENKNHSAWDLGTYGWNTSSWGQTPGYNFEQTSTGSGSQKTVTMRNTATATGDCSLHETNVSYTYENQELRPDPEDKPITMAEGGGVNVSYNVSVQQNGGFSCPQHRALLTTDFIWQNNATSGLGAGQPAVISVAHYDSGPMVPGSQAGQVIWTSLNNPSNPSQCTGGSCRVTVESNVLIPNNASGTTPISDDFGSLFQQYKSYIDPSGLPDSDFALRGVQIVSSNEGSDTTASVSNINATLTPIVTLQGSLSSGIKESDGLTLLCLDDYNNQTLSQTPSGTAATADMWPCTPSDNAQNWTYGWDGTLQVNGLCLDAYQQGTTIGTPIDLFQCDGGKNQQFIVGRWNEIWNPVSQLCLAVKGSSNATGLDSSFDLETCSGQPNEHWYTP